MQKIIDRIKTWEDAAKEAGIDPLDLPFKNDSKTARQEAVNAFYQLDVIAEVLRKGVVLDWTDSDQIKWYPWFYDYRPGSGFSFDAPGYEWSLTATYGGARLCVDTKEKAVFFGTQFLSIWNKFQNPN